ncbi:LrgB family protein [Ectopseudomonas khazarica]|uniref:LrgB family protein n=1 Tax=Ectopseudomonas khazarica TaxID=2502979 RepID=UPI001AEFC1FF|nr:LrgB family protein [Pseudomonas khazarica]QTS85100.1 LrgB family protein [Pseudomonas khazarica]
MTLLTHHPLFAIALTLAAFLIAAWLYRRSGWLVLQPVLVSVTLIVTTLLLCGVDYATYRAGAEPVAWLLGPATVALAVPLQHNIKRIRQLFWPIMITLFAGGVLSVSLTLAIGWALGADWSVVMSLAPKSVTMPIAMPVAEQIGGVASLAAVMVMLTGVIGTALGPLLLRWAGVDHPAARGVSYGINAHAIGTAHALQEGEECGAFAALGMSLLGIGTALLLPLLLA